VELDIGYGQILMVYKVANDSSSFKDQPAATANFSIGSVLSTVFAVLNTVLPHHYL